MSSANENNRQFDRSYFIESRGIRINDEEFRLNDIATGGLGIVVKSDLTFFMGQRLNKIELTCNEQSKTLKGIVSHITKNQQHIVCGIRFDFADHDEMEFVARFKEEMFG
jgi:hypothetical protein